MIKDLKFAITILVCSTCLASTPPPFAGECHLVDGIYSAVSNEFTRNDALQLLETIATGRVEPADYAVMARIGINIDISGGQHLFLGESIVRARALDKLGRSGLDAATSFLAGLTRESVGSELWPYALVALHRGLLARITDPHAKVDFLESTVTQSAGVLASWAIDELCNSNSQASLPVIRKSIHKWNPFPDGDAEIAFCEARMQVLSRVPKRVEALSSALRVDDGSSDPKLARWAAYQLVELGSPEADRELKVFALRVAALPDGSQSKMTFKMLLKDLGEVGWERGSR
jgi:hypothetical protein